MKLTYAMPAAALMIAGAGGMLRDQHRRRHREDRHHRPHGHRLQRDASSTFDAKTDLSAFKVGDSVKITYNVDPTTKKNMATGIAKD